MSMQAMAAPRAAMHLPVPAAQLATYWQTLQETVVRAWTAH